eukprot:363781-Chlamydomonas_euryale.AAC.26
MCRAVRVLQAVAPRVAELRHPAVCVADALQRVRHVYRHRDTADIDHRSARLATGSTPASGSTNVPLATMRARPRQTLHKVGVTAWCDVTPRPRIFAWRKRRPAPSCGAGRLRPLLRPSHNRRRRHVRCTRRCVAWACGAGAPAGRPAATARCTGGRFAAPAAAAAMADVV